MDKVGPLPASTAHDQSYPSSCRSLLTCIDRAARWLEAIPTADIDTVSIAAVFLDT